MAPHTITPDVRAVCRCKATTGFPHTNTVVITAEIESGFVAKDDLVPFRYCKFPRVAAVAEWYRYRIVAGFVTSSSPVPLMTRRVGQRCTLKSVES
ncbi:hypothetical protein TNCV_4667781 [Trichonephila clavipes]|nr:hypothetical protein TNCV_4667781 [Trichonephila clavipes]